MAATSAFPKRLDSLTGARFLAAGLVFVHHSVGPDNTPIVDIGYVGVTFFFVLSGFVLTWAGSADRGVITSYRNRFARIYPLHVLTLLIAIVLPGAFAANGGRSFVQNLLLLQSWTPSASSSYNWVSWSISNETFFYLLFPFALIPLRRCSARTLLIVAVLAWVSQGVCGLALDATPLNPDLISFITYKFPPFRFAEFLIGMCLALLLKKEQQPPRGVSLAALCLAIAGAAGAVVLDLGPGATRNVVISLTLPLMVVLIIALVIRESRGGARFFRTRPMLRLGEWSFAFYMTHALVIRVAAWAIGLPTPGYMPLWSIAPVFAVSVLFAWLAHSYVERPLERLLRAGRVKGSPPPTPKEAVAAQLPARASV